MHRRHSGPLAVQRAFHPESDGSAHVYILHPPGGVAGGDVLDINCRLAPQARCVLTTPGATKFYRTDGGASVQRTQIDVGENGICENLPQETILFEGADASINTRVTLAGNAVYAGWDFISLGRPAAGERFVTGGLQQRVEIFRDGELIWFERMAFSRSPEILDAPVFFAGRPIVGTMVYAGPALENTVECIRETLGTQATGVFSVSQLEHVIVCRYLGQRMSEGKALFLQAWSILRERGLMKKAVAPRIWAT
ncbi:urease accessory protein UreD [Agrobacterium sp. O3.4]|nr:MULTISPECIES: urease accessory protein UreD [Rhizobium/Agrobacterium group]MCZ7471511.1 urease accessory protein UreD [Rhizobium rhizogenes]MCZ7487911.1 urease accessory protein UreD [Rhizobium rhizogenes]MDA5634987.1 urease accessory protein UreD [Agrobacterium sp. ST15.16.024]MDF1890135.1 urease accessory protein UreD [Rhizobium rhizogenes]MDO3444981.1 urease accessory protein UreD [Agrobacterium sp. V1]